MKTRLLIIFVIGLVGFVTVMFTETVLAVPEPFSPVEMYGFAENVVFGKIISVDIISEPQTAKTENYYSERAGIAVYEIQVEKYFKKQLDGDTLTVVGQFLREPHGMSYHTYPYQEDQKVLLYLRSNEQGHNDADFEIVDPQSRIIKDELCPQGTYYDEGSCKVDRKQNEGLIEPESIIDERCGVDTVSIDGVCQVVKVEKTKTAGDDAPFFGFFIYLDNLISWIFGK